VAPANGPNKPTASSAPGSPILVPSIPLSGRTRRGTQLSVTDLDSIRKPSSFNGDDSSESGDDESFFVQETLPPESFAEGDLKLHVNDYPWGPPGETILQEIRDDPRSLEDVRLVPVETDFVRNHATYLH